MFRVIIVKVGVFSLPYGMIHLQYKPTQSFGGSFL